MLIINIINAKGSDSFMQEQRYTVYNWNDDDFKESLSKMIDKFKDYNKICLLFFDVNSVLNVGKMDSFVKEFFDGMISDGEIPKEYFNKSLISKHGIEYFLIDMRITLRMMNNL